MNPFGNLGVDLSQSELRDTAYEILVAACRSSGGGRPLTYVSNSERSGGPLQRTSSTTSISAASKVKKALGLKSKKKKNDNKDLDGSGNLNRPESVTRRSGSSVSELMRVQMRVTEQTDSRIRRGLLRIAAGQLGRRIESIVLPLELLQQLKSSDFTSQQEYEAWQRRSLKVLEAGLIVHPHLPLDKSQTAPQRLQQILRAAREKPMETAKHSESMQVLRNVVTSLSCREFDGSLSDVFHWADGIPLNFQLYQKLLDTCFDVNDEASIVEEVDEVLELIKKTWVVLGINQMFHNLCFLWLLFHRYVTIGQIEGDLLFAANNMMVEVGKDVEATHDSSYSKIASSIMTLILEWAEKMLLRYHDNFYRGNIDVMQSVLSLGVSAAKVLEVDLSHEYQNRKEVDVGCRRVEAYIRSSVHNAFSQAAVCSI